MLTCEQVDVLLTAAQHDLRPWLRVFTVLAAATGTRTGELCGLEWDDLDLDAGTVRFRQALSSIDQQLVTGEPRSDGRRGAAAAARSMARPGTMTEVAPAAPARLGPPLGRGRRHLLPAIPAPGGLPAGSRAPVAPRRSRPHPTAVGPRAARPGRRPPRDRPVHLVGDAASVGKPLRGLPAHVTVTARLRCDAALYAPAPPPTGRRGRPRVKGDRLPEPIVIAAMTRYRWTPAQVRCYGTTLEREVLAIGCLWYGALGRQPVQVVLSRRSARPTATSWRWSPPTWPPPPPRSSNAPATGGRSKPPSWTAATWPASARPVPAPSARWSAWSPSGWCLSLAICWYARHGQPAHDLAAHRARASWYRTKRTVSVADMLAALRRCLLAAPYPQGQL